MPFRYQISSIIVSYNCLESLKACVKSLENQTGVESEIIVIDNGSNDGTIDFLKERKFKAILSQKNLGYGAALQSLFKEAQRQGADVVVTLDADGQHDPRDISKLVGLLLETGEVDIVIGSRFVDGGGSEASGWRKSGIKLIIMDSEYVR